MNDNLNHQLEIFPVWSNIFYLLYSIAAFIILFLYKKRRVHFRPIVWVFIVGMIIEGIVSTVYHTYTTAYREDDTITKTDLAMSILDEFFANCVCLLLIFFIFNVGSKSYRQQRAPLNGFLIVLILISAFAGLVCFILDSYYEDKDTALKKPENYQIYDIFHSEWHTLTSVAFILTVLYIFINPSLFTKEGYTQYPVTEKYIYSLFIIILIGVIVINLKK